MPRKTIHLTLFAFGILTSFFLYLSVYLPYVRNTQEEWSQVILLFLYHS